MSTTKAFESTAGGACFPRSAKEWQEKGMPAEQAEHRMRQDVFGHDYTTDAAGSPIETGIGSAMQQTVQHKQAVEQAGGARDAMRSKVGYSAALAEAFDPRAAARIAELEKTVARLTTKRPRRRPSGSRVKARNAARSAASKRVAH